VTSQPISDLQLALSAGLLLVVWLLSWRLRLGLGRDLVIAGARMVVQLLLVGLILGWVFSLQSPWLVLGIALAMTFLAAQSAAQRSPRRYHLLLLDSFVAILTSSFLVTGVALDAILRIEPWYLPQYVVPVLGMVLGNSLTGVSLATERFTSTLATERDRVESLLALGAPRREAVRGPQREALRAGLIPTINSMAVMGVVSLPGMMTGQILAGADPSMAVRYQIVIMFVIACATTLACVLWLELAFRRLFDSQHRLRAERLISR
jgi:putative ABC transport system permease protein